MPSNPRGDGPDGDAFAWNAKLEPVQDDGDDNVAPVAAMDAIHPSGGDSHAETLNALSTVAQIAKPAEVDRSYFVVARLLALPDFALGGASFYAWWQPSAFDPLWIRWLLMFVLVEALMLMSQLLLMTFLFGSGVARARVWVWSLLAMVFGAMAIGVAVDEKAWWPFLIFAALIPKHVAVFVSAPNELSEKLAISECLVACVIYVSFMFVTMTVPLPEFGMGVEWAWKMELSGAGYWVRAPHLGVAMAALYFTALGLAHMFLLPLRLTRMPWFIRTIESAS